MNSLTLPTAPRRSLVVAGATLTALVSTAAWVAQRAQSARSQNPPAGNVVNVDDTQVHYLERGHGTPLVLLHGNTLRLEDFVASGLVERLARNYRVLAFDRPGFGYSERPRNRFGQQRRRLLFWVRPCYSLAWSVRSYSVIRGEPSLPWSWR